MPLVPTAYLKLIKRYWVLVLVSFAWEVKKKKCNSSITSVAVSIKQAGGVGEAGAVGVVVERAHTRIFSSAVAAWLIDRIAYASIGQPAGVTAVQSCLPCEEKLSHRSQLTSQRVAVTGRGGQVQFLRYADVKDFA